MLVEAVTQASFGKLETGLRRLADDLGDAYRATPETLEQALFGESPACYGALATEEGALMGVMLYSPMMSTALGAAGVYVSDLWAAPKVRGAGLGPLMLAWVAQDAKARWGAAYMRLVAYEGNPRSIAFYERLGFERPEGETALRLSGDNFNDLMRTT